MDGNDLVLSINNGEFDSVLNYLNVDTATIIKYRANDTLSVDILPSNYEKLVISEINKKNDGGYICFGNLNYYLHPPAENQAMFFAGFDSLLNIEWEVVFPVEGEDEFRVRYNLKNNNDNWVTLFTSWHTLSNGTEIIHNNLLEITEDGEIVRFSEIDTVGTGEDFLFLPESKEYCVFGSFLDGNLNAEHIKLYDSSFNYLGSKYFEPTNYCNSMYYNHLYNGSDTFLLAAPKRTGTSIEDIGFYKASILDSTIKIIEDFSIHRASHDRNVKNDGILEMSEGKFIIIGELNFISHSKVWVGSYDSYFILQNEKTIEKTDTGIYCKHAVSTSDGGLLLQLYYCEPISSQLFGYCLMKLDNNLQVEWTKPIGKFIPLEEWIVYPNPVEDILHIKSFNKHPFSRDYSLEIIDLKGNINYKTSFNHDEADVNISTLQKGTYIILIKERHSLIYSKKILKL